ncbi:2-acyl-glycerophospho-ethanolamine acyltransferase [Falsiruegeria litorea R37]|uniref:2-acyl-glycerophospho-ethanolamine acyltransferase n=1 Tax=Falsiruegeria litorea R37 TaxID=1200284 RepID=A0A1Y5TKB2_9RHOB|nr:lysophospholipid acyltransferase family protein [Falsiruegeria litorea]SLN62417.1 2-acyl-glycerophospho-ethanolamine acyltransferase [Falsiruegeria litorea R37]
MMQDTVTAMPKQIPVKRLSVTQVFLRGLGRIVMTAFFSRIEVVNAERFPANGPVLVVSNHGNSLVDGVLVSCYLPRMPRLLAASILWNYKPLIPLLQAAGVVPIFRQQDVGVKAAKEQPIFDRSSQVLAQGDSLSVFPEGLSHNQPHLLPFKSGAARMALEAESQGEDLGVQVLPVGLTFDEKNKFRSRVLIQVGEPMDISRQARVYTSTRDVATRRAVVRDLTGKIQERLAQVTLSFANWEDAQMIRQATDLWAATTDEAETTDDMLDRVELQRSFSEGYAWLKRNCPAEVQHARDSLKHYNDVLESSGLEVEESTPRSSAWDGLILLALLPMWLIGSTLNFVPFHVSRWVAHGKDEDKMATWSLFSSLILFPGSWIVQAVLLGALLATPHGFGWGAFWAAMILAPGAGYLALEFLDRRRRWFSRLRSRRAFEKVSASGADLIKLRANLTEQIKTLVDLYVNGAQQNSAEYDEMKSVVAEKNPQ